MSSADSLLAIQDNIWKAELPLEIRIAASESRTYDQVDSYLVSFPRLSFLASLLPRLLNYFSSDLIADVSAIDATSGWFEYESIPLKWHLPLGLLYDIYILSTEQVQTQDMPTQRRVPFKLTVHFSTDASISTNKGLVPGSERVLHDAFINSVKEADFLRSGTAKPIMSLSAADSKSLWLAAQNNDLSTFVRVYNMLFPPKGQVRSIPLRVYVPSAADQEESAKAQFRVLQGQFAAIIPATTSVTASQLRGINAGQSQTLGMALHALAPTLFPSRRTFILAKPVLHGAPVPMSANLEDLARRCCYSDGWVNIVIAMTG